MERILITVKTYPTLSDKYGELVCTAGLREDGTWVRIYPLPFRSLDELQKFKKFQWIDVSLQRNTKDLRSESFRPISTFDITVGQEMKDVEERRQMINSTEIFTNLQYLVSRAKGKEKLSLATFKPTKILDVKAELVERDWDAQKLAEVTDRCNRPTLFDSLEESRKVFKVVKKIPYKFSYIFEDDQGGNSHKLMIEDWEIGMLYLNCLKKYPDEKTAVQKVLDKYRKIAEERDVYLFLGTTLQFHNIAPQPFIIIGVFWPPKLPESQQRTLF